MKNKAKIKCDVATCENNNFKEGTCILDKVSISCMCDNDKCHDTCSTICQSFKDTGAIITDCEYEVTSEIEKEK